MNDRELHERGLSTAFAAWSEYAEGSARAQVRHEPGCTVAVFPSDPEAEFLNNTVLDRGLSSPALAAALERVEGHYAGIAPYAVWITDDDLEARAFLEARGYVLDTTTASMAIELVGPVAAAPFDAGPTSWAAYVEHEGGLLAGVDPHAFTVVTALLAGDLVAAAIGFEHEGDLGIYNVGTLEHARRRRLAAALTRSLINTAVERGCTTVTLQSTPMAERVYEACGFRTVTRILEFVPAASQAAV